MGLSKKSRPAKATPASFDAAVLQAILDSASQCILTVDSSGRILTSNTRFTEMFGYTHREIAGAALETLLPGSLRGVHVKHREGYFENPRTRPMGLGMELVAQRKDGTQFPVEISLSYVLKGKSRIAIAFVSDITARKTLEEQLVQSQKLEAVGRLAGGIAHDFNNLLTVITGYDRFLLERLSTMDPLRGYAEEILKASERASALTRQLLAFSRQQVIRPEVVELNEIIQQSEGMMRRLLGENIELIYSLRPGIGRIKADTTQIEQVMMNLLLNARDALADGGRILVETANATLDSDYCATHAGVQPGEYVLLSVSDNGSGMDAETQRHIFEPFFTTKPVDRGTGLGLATVYGIVKQNSGHVWVYSEVGVGTAFKIYWPKVATSGKGDTPEMSSDIGHETILVVEDEEAVRNLLRHLLQRHGYVVLTVPGPAAAVQLCEEHEGQIHLLLTDVVMPGGSGKDLAERLRRTKPGLPVLYISGYTENTIVRHGVLDSNVNFVQKPFAFEELLRKIRTILDDNAATG